MAQIDIGKLSIGPHKGDYNNSTAYVANDIVYYNGSAYIAKQSTTGNLPTDTNNWNTFSAGSGGIWDSSLSLGSAGQAVKVNAAGNALEFGAVAGGKILQVKHGNHVPQASTTSTSYVDLSTNTNVSITPSATSSKILILAHFNECYHNSGHTNASHYLAIAKDSTIIHEMHTTYLQGISGEEMLSQDLTYVDSPNTTSALTYKLKFRSISSSHAAVRINQNSMVGGSTITLLEIGA